VRIVTQAVDTIANGVDDLLLIQTTDRLPDWRYDLATLVSRLSRRSDSFYQGHLSAILQDLVAVGFRPVGLPYRYGRPDGAEQCADDRDYVQSLAHPWGISDDETGCSKVPIEVAEAFERVEQTEESVSRV